MTATTIATESNAQAKTLAALMTLGADIDGSLGDIGVSFNRQGGAHIDVHHAPLGVVLTILGLTGLSQAAAARDFASVTVAGASTQWLSFGDDLSGGIKVTWFVDNADAAYTEYHKAVGGY